MASRILIVGCAREGAELERRGHCLAHVVDARALPQWLADPEGWDVALLPPDLALLHALHKACPRTEVIVLALPGERAAAIRCLREGAFASVRRPCEGGELDALVERALERKSLRDAEAHLLALRGVLEAREKLPEAIWSAPRSSPPRRGWRWRTSGCCSTWLRRIAWSRSGNWRRASPTRSVPRSRTCWRMLATSRSTCRGSRRPSRCSPPATP